MVSEKALFWVVGVISDGSILGRSASGEVSASLPACYGVFFPRPGLSSVKNLDSLSIFIPDGGVGEINFNKRRQFPREDCSRRRIFNGRGVHSGSFVLLGVFLAVGCS